jgi:ATP-dependent Clp protease protease subunit
MKKLEEGLILGGGVDKFYEEIIKNNFDDRKIVLNENVDASLLEDVILWILKWNKEDKDKSIEERKKIFIFVNSLGGDVFTGLNLCDVIEASKTPIVSVCMAYGYSMGGVIFTSAHERLMFKNSSLLIHDGSTALSGSAGKVKDLQSFYNKVDERIKNIIVSNSKITSEEYDSKIDRELYMLADECKEKGLCDKIIGIDTDLDYIL